MPIAIENFLKLFFKKERKVKASHSSNFYIKKRKEQRFLLESKPVDKRKGNVNLNGNYYLFPPPKKKRYWKKIHSKPEELIFTSNQMQKKF